ncbi:HAMP domain-containing histidine kinase, partial [bacterium]|nr:HAMP domain-containing histidine kinase [bacterium]
MCDGVQRLLKVIEASKNYLSLDSSGKKVQFDYQSVASINDYFYDVLLHKLEDIEYIELTEDTYFCIDHYWLGMCVLNIVENALKHGEKPVKVALSNKNDLIEILVEDQGTISKEAMSQLTNPFARASSKEGMGLGLSLVKKVITQMGGKIRFKNNPTRVTLTVRKRQ